MAKALLHLDPKTKQLLGVWLNVRGVPTCYYEGTPTQEQRGRATIENRKNSSPWDAYCERLQERTPSSVWWETVDAQKSETPQQVFKRMVSISAS